MYYITEKHNAIKTVQRFLGQNQTGVFGKGTKRSVTAHQAQNGIEPTGIVDYETFNSLKDNYNTISESCIIFSSFPYKRGDSGSELAIINAIIGEVIDKYTFEGVAPVGEYYGDDTVEAVIRLREIFMLEHSEEIDEKFISRLITEKNAINLSQKNR